MDIPELPKVKLHEYSESTGKVLITFELLTPFDLSKFDNNKTYHLGLSEIEPDPVPGFNS